MKESLELSQKQGELIEEAFLSGNVRCGRINTLLNNVVVIVDRPNVIIRFDLNNDFIEGNKRLARLSKLAGVAKCSPDDTFDMKKGIKIARLKFLRKVLILCREFFVEDTIKQVKIFEKTGANLVNKIQNLDGLIEKFRITIQ